MPTPHDLEDLRRLPLDAKVLMTKARIREWVAHYGEDGVYISFSGGKDSTVLLHLVREEFPDVEAVFVNTGLEYPEIQKFVRTFDNVTIVRPKMSFVDVLKKYGYPLVNKDVSDTIDFARKNIASGNRETVRVKKILGEITTTRAGKSRFNHEKWKPLLDVDFNISGNCCYVMKKTPAKEFAKTSGKLPFIATLASESFLRRTAWLRHGCNAFDSKNPSSTPMSFWTEQDVLHYIKENNLPIASVYGDIVPLSVDGQMSFLPTESDELCCTGCDRTGCVFCMFGAHREPGEGRFERLKRTHPKQYDYCIRGGGYNESGLWVPDENGLGMGHVIEVFNKLYPKTPIKY